MGSSRCCCRLGFGIWILLGSWSLGLGASLDLGSWILELFSLMPTLREIRRRFVLPLVGIGLVAYYLFVYLPLGRRARSLDGPLQRAWQRLAASMDQTNSSTI